MGTKDDILRTEERKPLPSWVSYPLRENKNTATTSEEEKKQNVSPSLPNDDDAYAAFRKTLPANLRDTKDADYEQGGDYRSRRYWELSGKPKDFNEGLKNNMFTKEDDGFYHSPSVAYNKEKDEYEFMKLRNHPTLAKELHWYNGDKDGAPEFRKNYIIDKSGDYYRYVRRNAAPPSYGDDGGQSAVNTQTKTGSGTTTTTTTTDTTKDGQVDSTNTKIKLPDWVTNYPFKTDTDNEDVEDGDITTNDDPEVEELTKVSSYDDIFKKLSAGRDYEKEKELQEKREKIGRIADGLNAIYNVYTRARGIEPVVDRPQQSYSERAQRRRDMIADEEMQNAAAALQHIAREKAQRLADMRERQRLGIQERELTRREEKDYNTNLYNIDKNNLTRRGLDIKQGHENSYDEFLRAKIAKMLGGNGGGSTATGNKTSHKVVRNNPTNVRNSRYGNQGNNKGKFSSFSIH